MTYYKKNDLENEFWEILCNFDGPAVSPICSAYFDKELFKLLSNLEKLYLYYGINGIKYNKDNKPIRTHPNASYLPLLPYIVLIDAAKSNKYNLHDLCIISMYVCQTINEILSQIDVDIYDIHYCRLPKKYLNLDIYAQGVILTSDNTFRIPKNIISKYSYSNFIKDVVLKDYDESLFKEVMIKDGEFLNTATTISSFDQIMIGEKDKEIKDIEDIHIRKLMSITLND